jgi:hypothetical protein
VHGGSSYVTYWACPRFPLKEAVLASGEREPPNELEIVRRMMHHISACAESRFVDPVQAH